MSEHRPKSLLSSRVIDGLAILILFIIGCVVTKYIFDNTPSSMIDSGCIVAGLAWGLIGLGLAFFMARLAAPCVHTIKHFGIIVLLSQLPALAVFVYGWAAVAEWTAESPLPGAEGAGFVYVLIMFFTLIGLYCGSFLTAMIGLCTGLARYCGPEIEEVMKEEGEEEVEKIEEFEEEEKEKVEEIEGT